MMVTATATFLRAVVARLPVGETQKICSVSGTSVSVAFNPESSRSLLCCLLFCFQMADVVACCGTESVIREVAWGGSLHKEHVVRDVRLDANKQVSLCLFPTWRGGLRFRRSSRWSSFLLCFMVSMFVAE